MWRIREVIDTIQLLTSGPRIEFLVLSRVRSGLGLPFVSCLRCWSRDNLLTLVQRLTITVMPTVS
jgi:hypothetical protein